MTLPPSTRLLAGLDNVARLAQALVVATLVPAAFSLRDDVVGDLGRSIPTLLQA
jgi:hypothetical protein